MSVGEVEALAGYVLVLVAAIMVTSRLSRLLEPTRLAALQGERLLRDRHAAEGRVHVVGPGIVAVCLVLASGVTFFSSTRRAAAFLALGLLAAVVASWADRVSRRFLVELGERGRVLIDPDVQAEAPRRLAATRFTLAAFVVFAIPWPSPEDASTSPAFVLRGAALALAAATAIAAIVYGLRFQSAREYAIRTGQVLPDPAQPPS